MSIKSVKTADVNPIPEILFLSYGPAAFENDTTEFLEALAIYCLRAFGEIGILIEMGDYPAVKKSSRPTNAGL